MASSGMRKIRKKQFLTRNKIYMYTFYDDSGGQKKIQYIKCIIFDSHNTNL